MFPERIQKELAKKLREDRKKIPCRKRYTAVKKSLVRGYTGGNITPDAFFSIVPAFQRRFLTTYPLSTASSPGFEETNLRIARHLMDVWSKIKPKLGGEETLYWLKTLFELHSEETVVRTITRYYPSFSVSNPEDAAVLLRIRLIFGG